ncbi:LamG domain-containing protein [Brevibacillus brevis]|uniref:LamG domain-containing protein n=1 Tax=Brevibacillus brevis TaxID=1393 RepID=UPI0007D8A87C|nr:LamG domain-containing protein [Brevibacillus brevis]
MSGYALNFDGTSMVLPQKNITFGATWTIEMWIKPVNFDFGSLFGIYPTFQSTINGNGYIILSNSSGNNLNFGGILTNQVWQHIAITHSNGSVVLYRNGEQAGSGSLNLNVGSIQCYIAGRPNHNPVNLPGAYRFKGLMDEVRIWNTARTQDQISKNMKKRLLGTEVGLQSLWTFDEGTGTPKDLTSTANHLNWVGNGGTWNPPTYMESEIDFFKEKYLIKDNDTIKTYKNGSWKPLGSTTTDAMYLSEGLDKLDEILDPANNAISQLTSRKPELLFWHDKKPESTPSTVIPTMTSNTTPSGIASASSVLIPSRYDAWQAFTPDAAVEGCWYSSKVPTPSNPETLMYEFPTPKIISRIRIKGSTNINASPKDFDFIAWDGSQWIVLLSITNSTGWVNTIPRAWDIPNTAPYQKYGIRVYRVDGNQDYVSIGFLEMFASDVIKVATISGIPSSKYRYKVDFNNTHTLKDWTELTDQTVSDSVIISSAFLNSISPYKITVIAEEAFNSALATNYGTITLYDTEPTLIATVKGQKLHLQIGDNELDKVRFKVSINKKQVHPATGDFTPLFQAPSTFDYFINASDITLGGMNLLEIIAEDEFGKASNLAINFLGDYSGLMFVDESGKYFSDNIGNVLNYMDFGRITGGQTTLPKKVRVVNKNGFPIHNLLLTMNAGANNSKSVIQLSKTDSPFTPEDQISYTRTLENEQEVPVFVRVVTNKDDKPHSGTFEIVVNADPV